MAIVNARDPILLINDEGKRYLHYAQPGGSWFTNQGRIVFDDIIGHSFGRMISTDKGQNFLLLRPTTSDLIRYLKRTTQIVFPKDAAQLVMELDLWDGRRLIEAGTGSGGLTLAFARAVMPQGRVYSYEARAEHQVVARQNLERLGLLGCVDLKLRDISEGFDESEVDAVFLDVRDAGQFVPQAQAALMEGGLFGSLVPTANQVSDLLTALQAGDFVDIRVEEMLVRPWKPVPDRLRPADRMVAHTGYLVFARKLNARYRLWGADSRQKRRAVEFGQWPADDAHEVD